MAAEPNTGLYHGEMPGSALNRPSISFQSITSEMFPVGTYHGVNNGAEMMSNNSNIFNNHQGITQTVHSSGSSLLINSVPGLKHDAGLSVEWSVGEQYKLDEGLVKYANESNMMKYIKIAATLQDKTVRDVALRCRWMMRKRRKRDENNVGKKVTSRKEMLEESASKSGMLGSTHLNLAPFSLMIHQTNQNQCIPCEALSGTTKHFLEQNVRAFKQITTNISMFKFEDNIDLFCCTRNNLNAVLNDMKDMPGIMSQMPPLPVSINEDLMSSILSNKDQRMIFGSPCGIHLKHEPRC